jgi:Spy/CpxP family protein refolding chaperone
MTKKILIGLGALALVVAAGAAWAHGPGRHMMMKQMIDKRVAEAEDLIQATPDQRAQIEKSKNAIVAALQQGGQARRQEHQDIVKLLTNSQLSKDQFEQQLDTAAKAHLDQMQNVANVVVEQVKAVHAVLTPAQLDKLAQKAQEMHQKHQQQKGGFGGPAE